MSNIKKSSDVVIVGGGLTGYIAAYELAKNNVNVVMLKCGHGASPGISGFNIPNEKGDSVEQYIQDTLLSGRNQCEKKLVDALCNGTTEIEEYLEKIGFKFDHNDDGSMKARKSLGSSYARVVGQGNGSGSKILKLLKDILDKNEHFKTLDQVVAVRIITKNKKAYGVYAYDTKTNNFISIYGKAILLCTGGFAGILPFTSNSKDISGDGAAMALQAGCPLVDVEFIQFEPSSAVWPPQIRGKGMITTLFYEGALMRNGKGERFMLKYSDKAECVNKDILSKAIEKEILDGNATEHGGVWFDASGVDEKRLHDAYQHFIDRYAAVGIDLTREPVELANAAHTALGGVEIDEKCNTAIKGLYCAGEAAGHLHGANRIGGSAGSETLVFGRIAANSILNDIDKLDFNNDIEYKEINAVGETIDNGKLQEYKNTMKNILGKNAGVYRNGNDLKQSYDVLSRMYNEVFNSKCSTDDLVKYNKLQLENDLLVAKSIILAADARKDSCGCHQRLDFTNDPKTNYHTKINYINNDIVVSKIKNETKEEEKCQN